MRWERAFMRLSMNSSKRMWESCYLALLFKEEIIYKLGIEPHKSHVSLGWSSSVDMPMPWYCFKTNFLGFPLCGVAFAVGALEICVVNWSQMSSIPVMQINEGDYSSGL